MKTVRGMHDLLDKKAIVFQQIIQYMNIISHKYSFEFVKTPVLEFASLFLQTLDDSTDIISKEIYTFLDRSNDMVALRPEFTASMMRLCSNQNFSSYKQLFTYGPLFRYDRPQKGRYREFYQANFEILKTNSYISDVIILVMINEILQHFKISYKLYINSIGSIESRKDYELELHKYFTQYKHDLSQDNLNRLLNNKVLRILDSKENEDLINKIPFTIYDFLSESELKFYNNIKILLKENNIDYIENDKLVRGLDYYNNTIFEFISNDLTIVGGGRYNAGNNNINKENIPSVGFALGIERLMNLILDQQEVDKPHTEYGIYLYNFSAEKYFFNNIKMNRSYKLYNSSIKINKFLEQCYNEGVQKILIIGDREIERGVFRVQEVQNKTFIDYSILELNEVL